MTTDYSTGDMYWASFSAVGDWPASSLVKISMTEDWMFTVTDLGEVANATELVGLYVDPDPISELAPAVPEAFDVKPAPEGGLSAYLSWVNPSLRRDGSKLGEFTVNVYAGDVKIASIDGALPGEACSYEYTATEPAPVTFSVAASTEDGEGARAYADQVFVGEDRPAAVAAPSARRRIPRNMILPCRGTLPLSVPAGAGSTAEACGIKWLDASTERLSRMAYPKRL